MAWPVYTLTPDVNNMPLNNDLYERLVAAVRVGKLNEVGLPGKDVKIRNPGMPLVAEYLDDPLFKYKKMKVRDEGETYWVCCPGCEDARYRLCINHRWGVEDPKTNSRNLWMIHCFNEECQSNIEGFSMELYTRTCRDMLRTYGGVKDVVGMSADMGPVIIGSGDVIRDIPSPGLMTPINELLPTHPAYRLLVADGHDPRLLGANFNVQFCWSGNFTYTNHRIIFPIIEDNVTIGWQARYVSPDGDGNCKGLWNCRTCKAGFKWTGSSDSKPDVCYRCGSNEIDPVPKYWTSPGFSKKYHMYNYGNARKFKFGIIVEGPKNVIRIGTPTHQDTAGPAVAVFGHSISRQQEELLWTWRNGAVVLLFDPESDVRKIQRKTVEQLRGNLRRVVGVELDGDKDPKDVDHDDLWLQIIRQAAAQNVDLFNL